MHILNIKEVIFIDSTLNQLKLNGKLDEIIRYIDKLPNSKKDLDVKLLKIQALSYLQQIDEALDLSKEILDQQNKNIDLIEYLKVLSTSCWIYYFSGDYNRGYELLNKELEIVTTISPQIMEYNKMGIISDYFTVLGKFNQLIAKYDMAISLYQKARNLALKIEDSLRLQFIYGYEAKAYYRQGKFDEALDRYNNAYEIACSLSYFRGQALWLNGIGDVYLQRGNLKESLSFQEKSLELSLQINDISCLIRCYMNIGDIYFRSGQLEQAVNSYLKQDFDLIHDEAITSIYFGKLIMVYVYLGDLEHAKVYLAKIENIAKSNHSVNVQLAYSFYLAYFLKTQPKFSDKARAEFIFREIIENKNPVDYQHVIIAYLQLIEILLDQININDGYNRPLQTTEIEILDEIKQISNQLMEYTTSEKLFLYKLEVLIIMGYIALSELKTENAKQYFEEAKEISSILGINQTIITEPDNVDYYQENKSFKVKEKIIENTIFSYNFQSSINKIIHSIPRLSIIVYLLNNGNSTFVDMQADLRLSAGNLTRHCDKLLEAGYIHKTKDTLDIEKTRFVTMFSITSKGISEFTKYSQFIKSKL
ncbi:MAG: tetratricopeptide repeat protein [Candidatus Heimdallarchaeota archaeon]|nr:tetratricopeptide repeat protein [Candidatus Heimdallarchaeota archaeon]